MMTLTQFIKKKSGNLSQKEFILNTKKNNFNYNM